MQVCPVIISCNTDNISKVELVKRDETIQDLTTKYNNEVEISQKTQQKKQELELQLVGTILKNYKSFFVFQGDTQKVVEDQSQQVRSYVDMDISWQLYINYHVKE